MAEKLPSGDNAVFIFLGIFVSAFAYEGVSALFNGGSPWKTVICWTIATVLFVSGLKWKALKTRLGSHIASPLIFAANDSRFRSGALFIILIYISGSISFQMYQLRTDLDVYAMPRSVTAKQSEDLRAFLMSREPHTVTVKANPYDVEAIEYAGQLNNALKGSN